MCSRFWCENTQRILWRRGCRRRSTSVNKQVLKILPFFSIWQLFSQLERMEWHEIVHASIIFLSFFPPPFHFGFTFYGQLDLPTKSLYAPYFVWWPYISICFLASNFLANILFCIILSKFYHLLSLFTSFVWFFYEFLDIMVQFSHSGFLNHSKTWISFDKHNQLAKWDMKFAE